MMSGNSVGQETENASREFLSHSKQVILVKYYMDCTQDNKLILDILKLLGISASELVSLFLESGEEDRFIWIASEAQGQDLLKFVDAEYLIEKRLYKTLILLDRG